MSREDDIRQLIAIHQRRLRMLKEHSRDRVPILMEIEDVEEEIRKLHRLRDERPGREEKTERLISMHRRRLQKLQEKLLYLERDVAGEIRRLEDTIINLRLEIKSH